MTSIQSTSVPRRVAVTGMGLVSSIGNDLETVEDFLRAGKSGIGFNPEYKEKGLRSHISGKVDADLTAINRKARRFMGIGAAYGYLALADAIEQSKISQSQLSDERTALIVGSGGMASEDLLDAMDCLDAGGVRKVGPYRVTREMTSAPSAILATEFKIKGPSYSISSACATSAHCIGEGFHKIKMGLQDTVIAGGVDFAHWSQALQFDAMGALSTQYNEQPELASRPYDQNRDGFVISGGAGIVILEDWDKAVSRGAEIIAEVIGFGATSDGDNMVQPSGEGGERAMQQALVDAGISQVDYVNTHGTSTPAGDITELKAIARVFSEKCPLISSTKSITGHGLGAAGVQEAIFSLLMLQKGFVSPSANLESPDPVALELPIIQEPMNQIIETALSNSFGFGGTNACLIFKRADSALAH